MIDLRSDTVTMPSKEMKEFMFKAPLGDDVYGDDPTINLLEKQATNIFGKEKALFVPSGTMANLISLLTHCNRGDEIIVGNKSHIFVYEAGGVSVYGGIHSHQLENNEDGTIDINKIISANRNPKDSHHPITRLVCLENTHNICYGVPIEESYFKDVRNAIESEKIKIHIDGARIFNASVALKTTVKKLSKYADSITCCLSKGLGAPAGSLIMGDKEFIYKARRIRKSLGGGMRQSGILAAAGLYSFENMITRIEEDHQNAYSLAKKMNEIDEINLDLNKIYTNIIFFHLHNTNIEDKDFISQLLENNIKIDSKGNRKFRMVTHFGFTKNDVNTVIEKIKKIFNNYV